MMGELRFLQFEIGGNNVCSKQRFDDWNDYVCFLQRIHEHVNEINRLDVRYKLEIYESAPTNGTDLNVVEDHY